MAPNDDKYSPTTTNNADIGNGHVLSQSNPTQETPLCPSVDEETTFDDDIPERNHSTHFLSCGMEEEILGPVEDTLCGLGKLRGRFLQKLAQPITYLFISSVVALVQGMFFTYSNATLSTIEKRFSLPSKISGFTTTGNDLVQLVLSVHITYLAGRGHRPRWLAFGMLGASIGCVLATMPHFIFGGENVVSMQYPQQHLTSSKRNKYLCNASNSSSSSCGDVSEQIGAEQYTVVSMLLIAQMLAGFASMLYYTIGYSYLDEAVSQEKVPLFLAVSGSLRILGPVCGYSMASWCLGYWVNPSNPPDLSPKHPAWIGAWWVGYLVIGATLFVITWSLMLLPKTLPGARQRTLMNLRASARKGKHYLQEFTKTLRPSNSKDGRGAICSSLRRILTNRVYVLIIINQIFFWFAFFGYITFKPKYLEHQFKMSAAKANQYIAGAAMAATLVGWLGTGAALTFFRPRAKYVISFMGLLSTINCALHICMVNISCDHDTIHGMDHFLQTKREWQVQDYASSTNDYRNDENLLSQCSSECNCSPKFSPVCVDGTNNFYNPCFAGCTSSSKRNKTIIYEHCSCSSLLVNKSVFKNESTLMALEANNREIDKVSSSLEDSNETAYDGYCSYDCPAFYMYLTLTVLTKMTHAASRVPVNLILFRCVEERDKDVGLGIFNAALALFSSIPAPIIFGWIIDQSCQLWENTCGQKGFCWLYDLNTFRYILHGIPAVMMCGCLITEIILLSLHKSIHFYGKDVSEESKESLSGGKEIVKQEETVELNPVNC